METLLSTTELTTLLLSLPRAQRLTVALERTKVQQRWLAKQSGLTYRTFNYALHEQRVPPYESAVRIAYALHIHPDVLWTESGRIQTGVPLANVTLPEWEAFAADYDFPSVQVMVAEAVHEYMAATEDAERGYEPPDPSGPPLVVMSAYEFAMRGPCAICPAVTVAACAARTRPPLERKEERVSRVIRAERPDAYAPTVQRIGAIGKEDAE